MSGLPHRCAPSRPSLRRLADLFIGEGAVVTDTQQKMRITTSRLGKGLAKRVECAGVLSECDLGSRSNVKGLYGHIRVVHHARRRLDDPRVVLVREK